jgi:hypothetical protein
MLRTLSGTTPRWGPSYGTEWPFSRIQKNATSHKPGSAGDQGYDRRVDGAESHLWRSGNRLSATERFTIRRQICHSTARPQRQQVHQNHDHGRRPLLIGLLSQLVPDKARQLGHRPGSHDGPRWPTIHTDDGTSVDIATVQNDDGDVVVWVDAEHGSMLNSEQARATARALLEAASWVDDHPIT